MKREDAARVLSGGTANPDDKANEGLVGPDGSPAVREQIVVGAHGVEEHRYVPTTDYSEKERDFIADAASERGDEELSTLVRGGLKLKAHRQEPPPEKTPDETTRDIAIGVARTRKEQLQRSEAELGDHKLSRSSLEDLAYVDEMLGQGYVSGEAALAEQQRVLDQIENIEDDELRHQTLESAVAFGYVDEPLYERHVEKLQHRYAEHQMSEYEARAQQTEQQMEEEGRIQEAVIGLEEQRLNALSPLAQTLARTMIEEQADSIAGMGAKDTFLALAQVRNLAKLVADSITQDNVEADIVRAWDGPMRPGSGWDSFSRRERRDFNVHDLGLGREPWTPEMQDLARRRAEAEVERDIRIAQRHQTHGLTGKEKADLARMKLSAQMLK